MLYRFVWLLLAIASSLNARTHNPVTPKSLLSSSTQSHISFIFRKTLVMGLMSTSAITISALASTAASHYPDCIILYPGFMQPRSAYRAIEDKLTSSFPSAAYIFMNDSSSIDNPVPLIEASRSFTAYIRTVIQPRSRLVLVGHSRGGAVTMLATQNITHLEYAVHVVLLDPVDDSAHSATNQLTHDDDGDDDGSNQGSVVLLVSTPYGGSSSFYRSARFTSACAPEGRNAESFLPRLIQRGRDAILLRLPDVGHLQLLSTSTNSICAASDKANKLVPMYLDMLSEVIKAFVGNEQFSRGDLENVTELYKSKLNIEIE